MVLACKLVLFWFAPPRFSIAQANNRIIVNYKGAAKSFLRTSIHVVCLLLVIFGVVFVFFTKCETEPDMCSQHAPDHAVTNFWAAHGYVQRDLLKTMNHTSNWA